MRDFQRCWLSHSSTYGSNIPFWSIFLNGKISFCFVENNSRTFLNRKKIQWTKFHKFMPFSSHSSFDAGLPNLSSEFQTLLDVFSKNLTFPFKSLIDWFERDHWLKSQYFLLQFNNEKRLTHQSIWSDLRNYFVGRSLKEWKS